MNQQPSCSLPSQVFMHPTPVTLSTSSSLMLVFALSFTSPVVFNAVFHKPFQVRRDKIMYLGWATNAEITAHCLFLFNNSAFILMPRPQPHNRGKKLAFYDKIFVYFESIIGWLLPRLI